MTQVTVSAFRVVPDFARGLVRDLRVRWALEELGKPYDMNLIDFDDRQGTAYRALQPFGQVPAVEVDGAPMFETGAILFALAEGTPLMAPGVGGRNVTLTWMFAALNTVEPDIALLSTNDFARTDVAWTRDARETLVGFIERKLGVLDTTLADRDYLAGSFTVADILMSTVLRFLNHTDLVAGFPNVAAYQARCESRPAFRRALDAQFADYDRPLVAAA
ncbi:MAG: glutathione S-transferase family protein [Croceibacterium sp.]